MQSVFVVSDAAEWRHCAAPNKCDFFSYYLDSKLHKYINYICFMNLDKNKNKL